MGQSLRMINLRGPDFCARHVKTLCLSGTFKLPDIERLLSVCTGTENLFIEGWPCRLFLQGPNLNENFTKLSFRRIYIKMPWHMALSDPLPTWPLQAPFATNLTHLDMRNMEPRWFGWLGYERMYRLTHLAMQFFFRVNHHRFTGPDSLRVVVLFYPRSGLSTLELPDMLGEIKPVLMPMLAKYDMWAMDTVAADFWELAEHVLQERARTGNE